MIVPGPIQQRPTVAPPRIPRTPTEKLIAEVWSAVLGVDPIGIDDSFFDLGGHSLLAVKVATELRRTFGISLPLQTLFDAPTVAALAIEVDRALKSSSAGPLGVRPPILHRAERSFATTSLTQEYRLLFNRLTMDGRTNPCPAFYELRGKLQPAVLQTAFDTVVRRHDALRMVFSCRSAKRALVGSPLDRQWVIEHIDLSMLGREKDATKILEPLLERFATEPFDLRVGPTGRALLVRVSENSWILGICVDHVAFDGASLGIVVGEVSETYNSLVEGRPSSLASLPYQFPDYAQAQRSFLDGPAGRRVMEYWFEQFARDGMYPPELRLQGAVDPQRTGETEFLTIPLDAEVISRLQRRCGEHNASLYMGCLTAVLSALRRQSSGDRLGLTISESGRDWEGTESLVGCFVHNLQLWLEVPAKADFRELLGQVRDRVLQTIAHSAPLWHLVAKHEAEELATRYFVPRVHFLYQLEEPANLALSDVVAQPYGLGRAEGYLRQPVLRIRAGRSRHGWQLMCEFVKAAYDTDAISALLHDTIIVMAQAGERGAFAVP